MPPDLIVNAGAVICVASIICAVIAVVVLRLYKKYLDDLLDAEYGKRRR